MGSNPSEGNIEYKVLIEYKGNNELFKGLCNCEIIILRGLYYRVTRTDSVYRE